MVGFGEAVEGFLDLGGRGVFGDFEGRVEVFSGAGNGGVVEGSEEGGGDGGWRGVGVGVGGEGDWCPPVQT